MYISLFYVVFIILFCYMVQNVAGRIFIYCRTIQYTALDLPILLLVPTNLENFHPIHFIATQHHNYSKLYHQCCPASLVQLLPPPTPPNVPPTHPHIYVGLNLFKNHQKANICQGQLCKSYGWFSQTEYFKMVFLKYWQVQSRLVFTQVVTYGVMQTYIRIKYTIYMCTCVFVCTNIYGNVFYNM